MEIIFVVVIWVTALAVVGYNLVQEMRARQLRERVTRLTQTRILMAEEERRRIEDEELKAPLLNRVFKALLLPTVKRLGRLIPQAGGTLKTIDQLLVMAGRPLGLSAGEIMGLRLLAAVIGGVLGIFLPNILAIWVRGINSPIRVIIAVGVLSIIGFLAPMFVLRRAANRRRHFIRRQLPDMLDLIILSIEAGLGFDGAVYEAARRFKGPLSDELMQVMREVSLGKTRAQALRDMAERIKLEDISLLVSSVHQAETLGAPLADALKALSVELRKKRLRFIREQVAKLPVKLIFPLVLFIFPTLFIVILGPAGIQLTRTSLGVGGP